MPRGRPKKAPVDLRDSPVGQLYDTEQVALFLGVTKRTVQRWIRENRLPAAIVGGTYRVSREALQGFVKVRG
jgi:excisionase family DNA binding protein